MSQEIFCTIRWFELDLPEAQPLVSNPTLLFAMSSDIFLVDHRAWKRCS